MELSGIGYDLPDGRPLLTDVSFRAADGAVVALVGANGSGKTTLLRMIAGDLDPHDGTISRSGGLGVMRQFIGSIRDDTTVRELLFSLAPPRIRDAAAAVDALELRLMDDDSEAAHLRYAEALAEYADAGGYDAEVTFDACCTAALGIGWDTAKWREVNTLSGGEQKRLALEALLRGPDEVLLLDEPDNYLDVPGKRWLEDQLRATRKTVLLVSHDRELLARAATSIAALELGAAGNTLWVHGRGFDTFAEARRERFERFEEFAPALGRAARPAAPAHVHVQAEGRVQLRHGLPIPVGPDPAGEVRAGRAAPGGAAAPTGVDAADRRPDGQTRDRLRGP